MIDSEALEMARTLLGNHDTSDTLRDLSRMDAEDIAWLCSQGEDHKAADLYVKRISGKGSLRSARADFAKMLADRAALFFYLNARSFADFVDSHPVYRLAGNLEDLMRSAELLRRAFISWYAPSQNCGWVEVANAILGDEGHR